MNGPSQGNSASNNKSVHDKKEKPEGKRGSQKPEAEAPAAESQTPTETPAAAKPEAKPETAEPKTDKKAPQTEEKGEEWAVEFHPGNVMAFYKPWDSGEYDT